MTFTRRFLGGSNWLEFLLLLLVQLAVIFQLVHAWNVILSQGSVLPSHRTALHSDVWLPEVRVYP
jgi:hypothetical protein